ncbi:DUF7331 family protein [Halobiforma nitratireducens]|uniref:DUF7331 family protein n=1 Tax=Halobiforma nitratireducens TaxID=130048 RepID=UPI00146166BC|nr:hypothetical protein [Halobiforma nitratireducens]
MRTQNDDEQPRARERPLETDFDRHVCYEDEDGLVICDRRNASAWVRCRASDLSTCPR